VPWDAERVWAQLRVLVPVRRGVLAPDDTSFPKQGRHSPGVKRQYCGALGKTANCQVAVSTVRCGASARGPWVPQLHPSRGVRLLREFRWRGTMDLTDERSFVSGEKRNDSGQGQHKRPGQIGIGRGADHDQQRGLMFDHGGKFVRLVADPAIVGHGNPATP